MDRAREAETPEIECVACTLCGSRDARLLFATGLAPAGARHGIVRCRSCGLVYRDVRATLPRTLEAYATRSFADVTDAWVAGRKAVFAPYMARLEPHRQTGRILDVGAGHGFFLALCKDRGWECHGVEPSIDCSTFAAGRFGLALHREPLERVGFPDGHFDVVTFWNVLDELTDPRAALREAHRILRPGGLVLARSPNADFHVPVRHAFERLARVIPRLAWRDLTTIHLHAFDRRSLARLCAASGFEPPRVLPPTLSWTTTPQSGIGRARRLVARTVERATRLLHALSGGTLLVSPSYLMLARKPVRDGH